MAFRIDQTLKKYDNIITSLNLQLYEDILIKDNLENEFYNIEIDSNDDNKTI